MDDYNVYLYFCFLAMFVLFFCHIVHAIVEQKQVFCRIAQKHPQLLSVKQNNKLPFAIEEQA